MSTLTAPIRPPLADDGRPSHHHRIIERTITVTRELVVDGGDDIRTRASGLDRIVLRLALWLIDRRRVRALHVQVDSAEMSRRVDEAKWGHIDRYHGLPF
ncbi:MULTISPECIES: hypothetical protein [unclassified Brevibacterium]|uniref:hypothetical protein n=1 Tax=unclassified Brevibacterium TaxID=2614124 RepID=UPI001091D252|nr:hypothetical protein [Brevibacterium sp. S22]TGD32027.1 hypothetical protein EB835_05940 [Brevibacterium sp. S22]